MLLSRTCCIDCLLGNIKPLEFTACAVIYVDVVTQKCLSQRWHNRNNIESNQFLALYRQICWECLFILCLYVCASVSVLLFHPNLTTQNVSLWAGGEERKKAAHTKTGELLKLGLLSFLRESFQATVIVPFKLDWRKWLRSGWEGCAPATGDLYPKSYVQPKMCEYIPQASKTEGGVTALILKRCKLSK